MNRQTKFSPELRERAIRMVYEQRECEMFGNDSLHAFAFRGYVP